MKMALRRYVHLVALEEIGRPPNAVQRDCIERLRRHAAVCGSRPGMFPIPPGRSGAELIASLARLETFIDTNKEFQDHYIHLPFRKSAEE